MEWNSVRNGLPKINGSQFNEDVLVAEFDEEEEAWSYFVASCHREHDLWVNPLISNEDSACVITREIKDEHLWAFIDGPELEKSLWK